MNPLQVLTPRGGVFFVVGLTTTLAGMGLGYPDLTRIGVLLTALPLIVLMTARRRPPRLVVGRSITPRRLRPDEPGDVRCRIRNVGERRTPLYMAADHVDVHLGDRPRFVLYPMTQGEYRDITYTVRSQTRGAYRLGPLTLRQRDPFGLIYVSARLSSTVEMLVLPAIHELSNTGAPATGRGTEGEQPHMVALRGEDDVSIRSYRQGDELRRVHWPATAHRGELMVRQEDRPARRRAVLILDARRRAHGVPTTTSPSFEYAISALASAARALLAEGYVVHLLTPGTVREGSAAQHMPLPSILDTLARTERVNDSGFEAIAAAAHTFTAGGVLAVAAVVAYDAEQLRQLAAIRDHASPAMAFVLQHQAFNAPGAHPPATMSRADPQARGNPALILSEAGWSVAEIRPETHPAAAWQQMQRGRTLAGR